MPVSRRGLLLLVAVVLGLAWLAGRPRPPLPPPPLGAVPGVAARPAAPEWSLPGAGNPGASLVDYRGRLLVLNFWATWCRPCRDELPALQALEQALAPEGLAVVGISVDVGEAAAVARFAREREIDFPMLHDPAEAVARRYGTLAWPTTFVIDRRGRIVHHVAGAWDWNAPETHAALRQLLESPAGSASVQ